MASASPVAAVFADLRAMSGSSSRSLAVSTPIADLLVGAAIDDLLAFPSALFPATVPAASRSPLAATCLAARDVLGSSPTPSTSSSPFDIFRLMSHSGFLPATPAASLGSSTRRGSLLTPDSVLGPGAKEEGYVYANGVAFVCLPSPSGAERERPASALPSPRALLLSPSAKRRPPLVSLSPPSPRTPFGTRGSPFHAVGFHNITTKASVLHIRLFASSWAWRTQWEQNKQKESSPMLDDLLKQLNELQLSPEEEMKVKMAFFKRFYLEKNQDLRMTDIKLDLILKQYLLQTDQKPEWGVFRLFGRNVDITKVIAVLTFFLK